jgi:hypothetical protein
MADIVRRQKDIITRTVDKYKQTTLKDYAKYFEGSPTYVTYYQLDSVATQQDTNLENVNNLIGANSPNKYKKIEDVVIYGVDALQISNEISEKGLQSLISGDFVLLPDSIRPYPGDFFVFDDSELQEHLFRINDVQFDKASPRKFFRCAFSLYQDNADLILGNIEGDYVLDYQSIAGETSAVLKKEDAALSENVKKLVDGIIDKYNTLFYDEDMDTFACRIASTESADLLSLWSPYLQKFVHDQKVLEKYSDSFMTEIYVNDINQSTNREIFSDLGYFNSIFRRMEIYSPATFDNSFMSRDQVYDLKSTRNLPFFFGTHVYNSLQLHAASSFYPNAFHLLFQNYDETFNSAASYLKFVEGTIIYGGTSGGTNPTTVTVGAYFMNTTSPITLKLGTTGSPSTWSNVTPTLGQAFLSSTNGRVYSYNGSSWVDSGPFSDGTILYEVDTLGEAGVPVGIYRVSGTTPVDIGFSSTADISGETLYNIVKNYLLDSYVTGSSISGTVSAITSPVSGVYTYTLTVTGGPSVTTDLLLEKISGVGSLGTGPYVSAVNGSVLTIKSSSLPVVGAIVFKFINRLNVTDTLLQQINSLFLTTTIKNYVFLPLVLYILKESVSTSTAS